MRKIFLILSIILICTLQSGCNANGNTGILVEAESFTEKGGWSVDQQFTFEMGSPYLIAHGLRKPVEDAATIVRFPKAGSFYLLIDSSR
jgi:hypothetical protein